MTSTPLAEAASQFTLEDVVAHGQRQGRTPEQIATAVKRWRDGAREFGEAKLKESDPLKWFRGNAKLDSRIRDELDGVKVIAATEMIARTIRDEADRSEFVRQYQEFNGDPSKFAEGSGARNLAETLHGLDRADTYNLPDASDRVAPLATEAGVMLGDFETQARPGNGGLDILIRLDDKEEGSKRKSITIPEVTDDEITTARSKAEEDAKKLREAQQKRDALARAADMSEAGDIYGAPNPMGAVHRRRSETARIEAETAESRVNSLADPERGRLVLLKERVEEQIKSDKDLKKIAGDVALGEDFWRGVQQTHLGARMAIADAKGDEEEKTKLRGLIGELGQIYPGSTNYQFRGGAGGFTSDVSAVMGGMLPTMMVGQPAGIMNMVAGRALTGGLSRAAAISPISLSAYGNAYATMLNEADSLEQQGRVKEAEQRRRDARTYAMLSAAVETGSELIFKEEMFGMTGKGFLRKVGTGAAQNTAEEFVASVGNAELNREFRDVLTPVSQIAYESALGTVVGGLMQVPGGVVEVFLPKAEPAPQAPPPPDESAAGDPGTPPPSSPPPAEEGSPPPPEEGSTPPPQDPGTPPPVDETVYKVGERLFTWSETGWTEQATGAPVDPQAEPGLVFQLDEARRKLEAGETPVPQEVTLNPGETPAIFTIDGQRSFMPAPDGRGWLEVFPQTGEASRPVNFASEGEIGVAILRRLQTKIAEKQAAASPPANEAAQSPANESEISSTESPSNLTPEVDDRPADGVVSSGKPKGAKARFRWRILSRADLEAMVVRDIEEAQTRQRKGNVASDEQRERMATGLDPDLVMESPVSSMGAPTVFQGKVLAGNGRADGIAEAYRRGLAGDYEARIREFAEERGLDVPDEPILIREIIDFAQGDARSFVVESNPKRGGMLAESVSEQALLDSETIGDDVLANLTFTADGNLTAGSLSAVAARLEEANRGITRTLSGQFDRSEAGRRVMAAFLSRLISRAGRDASDVASILETDGGKRAVSAIAQAAPRLSKLDDDLSLASPIVESLLEFKSGLSAVSKGEFANMADWIENRTSELLAANLDPVSREILTEMANSVTSGAAMRELIDAYLEEAETEQKERDIAVSTGDIFGNERANRTAEDIFRKLGRISTSNPGVGAGVDAASPNQTGGEAQTGRGQEASRGAEAPPVSETPSQATEAGGAPKITDNLRLFPPGLRPMVKRMRELASLRKPTWDDRREYDLADYILSAHETGRKMIPREIWPWFGDSFEYLDRVPEFADMFSVEELEIIREDLLKIAKSSFSKNPPEWMDGTNYPANDDVRIRMLGTVNEALEIKEQSPPPSRAEAEGQLLPESELPFNLAGEVITEAEAVIPEDTRTDAGKDADSGQERLFDDRITPLAPAAQSGVAEANSILDDLLRRFPEKNPRQLAQQDDAAQERISEVNDEVRKYFGGDVPTGVRVVWEPDAVWDANFNRDTGTIELNAALLRPGEVGFKIDHEVGHVLFQDAEFAATFDALWSALPKLQRDRISRKVGKSVEKGYYSEGDAFEETRVRALEAIRRMAVGDHADAGVKRAWRKFLAALTRAWKRITGREPVDPERLAAAMIEIGVARMRSGAGGSQGMALSTIDFEGFKAWALDGIEPDGFTQEDMGRLWVAADVEGNVNILFGNFADADEYFRTNSERGEFLWDVTESYERMVGGIPLRNPDGPITPEDAASRYYPVDPALGETPAEAGNLPRVSPTGQPVTSALLPDMGLRYGLGYQSDATESRKLPDPNQPHRTGGRIFSISNHGDVISGGPEMIFASTSVSHLRSQPQFDQAKNHGNFKAAAMLVDRIVKPSVIEDVRNSLDPGRPVVIIPVLAQEGTSLNALPVAMAERLGGELSAEVWTRLYKLSSIHNTDASANDRARTVHSWSGQAPPKGTQIVLVDDTYTSGQTLVSMAAHIGYPPSAVVTISSGRYGKRWKANPAQAAALLDKAGIKEDDFFEIYGSTIQKALTGAQIHQYRLNGRAGRSGLLERFPAGTGESGTGTNQGNASQGTASERQVKGKRIFSLAEESRPGRRAEKKRIAEFLDALKQGDASAASALMAAAVEPPLIRERFIDGPYSDRRADLSTKEKELSAEVDFATPQRMRMLRAAMEEVDRLYETDKFEEAENLDSVLQVALDALEGLIVEYEDVDGLDNLGETDIDGGRSLGTEIAADLIEDARNVYREYRTGQRGGSREILSDKEFVDWFRGAILPELPRAVDRLALTDQDIIAGFEDDFRARDVLRNRIRNPKIYSMDDAIERQQSKDAQALANLESTFRVSFFAGDFDGSMAAIKAAEFSAIEAFVKKHVRLAKAGNLDAAGILEWMEHIGANTKPETVDAEIEELLRAKRARFPGRRSSGMRDILDRFFTAAEFERAFAQYVTDGNFQKAYEAVRDSDDNVTIPTLRKWMKAVRAGDPAAKKNLEWISAIFNGTVPPGVNQQPTSGPAPSSGTATPPPQQQASPPPPPPTAPKSPPPRPQGVEKLNIPALVFLARKMGTTPLVRKFRARGSFQPSNNRGEPQESPLIKVNEFLGKEDWQGAARTLAHEIGHFIDYIVNAVPYADIVKRLIPLEAIRDQFIEDIFGQGTKYSEARKYMMDEAIALSKIMRGDFADNDAYRKSAVELYADFMSAVMIDPDLAFDTAPLMSHAWFAHLDQKPDALAAWNLVQDLLKGDALHEAIRKDRVVDQRAAMAAVRDRADRRSLIHQGWKKIRNGFAGALWSRYLPAAAKGATKSGRWEFTKRWWDAVTNPKEGDFLARMEGAEIEASQRGSVLRVKMQRDVYDPLLRHGIDTVQLDEYLTFFQIVNEDTATRQYLEENPDEFREFLLWLDDVAGLGRASEIEGASDAGLDLIGASMVGTIQLHEKFETVYAMAQSSDAPDIAGRGLFAFDIARYQWNQDGHTPETAQKGIDFLRRELGDERFGVLRDAARAFHQNLAGIVREANQVGLFGERIWNEKIEPNLGNYVPRMVLDYFTGEMSASIKQRRGSVKATLPKYLAGEGQAMVLLHKIAKQKQMLFILEQAGDAGWANEIQPINIPQGKNVEAVSNKLLKEERKGLRGYFVKGKWKWLVFDDADVVRWMDTVVPTDLKFIYDIAKANEGFWRLSVTVLNASFALYNNWVRMAITLPMDYGPRAVAHTLRQIPEAVNWAKASLGLAAPSDRVLELVERGVLPAFGQYTAGDMLLSHDDLIDQISSGLVGIDALRRGTRVFGPFEKVLNLPGIHQTVQFLGLFTGSAEALPKLAIESLLSKRGVPQWERDRLARMEGIPNTGLSAGKFGTYAGLFSLFYRVWVQGTRRFITLPFNPRTRGAWWTGNILGLGAIKMFYAAAAAGFIDAMMGGDDEEKQVDWQEAYTRVSPYKIRMTDAFFLGWALPDGSYEAPWGHSSIPANWKPIMWRLPFTESGRVTAPLATVWSWNMWDSPLNTRSRSDAGRQARDVFFNSAVPSLNPIFENAYYATSLFDPRSPYNPYSGKDVVPKDQWDAGIPSRAWGITKHLIEETPLKNLAPAVRNGIKNESDLPPWARAVMSIPGSSAAISFDSSQLAADYMDRIEDRDSVNRKARLLRGAKTKAAVSLRSRLSRIPADSRTPAEHEKIEILNQWYRAAYMGNSTYPGLFRELQAHAAGMDGVDEKGAKEALEETAVDVLREIGRMGR